MIRSANPALNEAVFDKERSAAAARGDLMTLQGTVAKTGFMLFILVMAAVFTWRLYAGSENPAAATPWIVGGAIGGLVVALITIFKKTWAPFTAPVYAALEGLFLGGISASFEAAFPGIVFQAVLLTFGTLAVLLLAFSTGLIKATENFKLGIVAATGGIFLVYLATIVLGFFGVAVPYIHDSGPIGIGFSIVVVIIAALNLVLDFDFIENGAERGAPKYMEWYGAFGLMVTLVWLYLEILHLLAKLQRR